VSDAAIDDLLDDFVPPVQQLPDWHGVLRRARRSRRRHALLAVAIVALVVVPAALAVGGGVLDWFHGKPAPASVKQEFVQFNTQLERFAEMEAKDGFRREVPSAVAERAHGVIALRAAGMQIYLWAAPRRGGGACTLLQWGTGSGKLPMASTGCDATWPPAQPLSFSTMGGAALPAGNVVYGRAFRSVVSVVVELSNGARLKLPVVEGFFVGLMPKHTHPIQIESYRSAGNRVALVTSAGGTAALSAVERRALSRVSATGTMFPLPAGDIRTKRLVHGGYDPTLELLATRAGRRYFRLTNRGQRDCYAIGRTGLSWPLGKMSCRAVAPPFPSPELPIADLSTFGASPRSPRLRLLHAGGIAADGVARIVVKDREGRGLVWLPVRGNVYDSGTMPLPRAAVQLQAQDARGTTLAQVPR
jgi:hypothetical protein